MAMEKRWRQRRVLSAPAQAIVDGKAYDCMIHDLSQSGTRLTLPKYLALPRNFELDLTRNASVIRRCHLVWQEGPTAGVRFLTAKAMLGESSGVLDRVLSP